MWYEVPLSLYLRVKQINNRGWITTPQGVAVYTSVEVISLYLHFMSIYINIKCNFQKQIERLCF